MILLTLAASQSAMAQSASKVELFGGYSHLWEHKKHSWVERIIRLPG
jgi:hypothetical protein